MQKKAKSSLGANILKHQEDNNFYYLIGLICTDGYITWKGKTPSALADRCCISQHTRNSDILYKIKNKFGGIVVHERNRPQSTWATSNSDFVKFLRFTVGLGVNKTFELNITKWFNTLNEVQKRYFVRGVIDGDGNVFYDKRKNVFHKISIFSASTSFITMLSVYLNNSKIYIQKPRQNSWTKNIGYSICVTGKKCVSLFAPIFNDVKDKACITLEYKYNDFNKIKERYKKCLINY